VTKLREEQMVLITAFLIVLSGYVGFAVRREGASMQRTLLRGAFFGAMLQTVISTGMAWLSGIRWTQMIDSGLAVWALAFVAVVLGAFAADLCPQREPIARW